METAIRAFESSRLNDTTEPEAVAVEDGIGRYISTYCTYVPMFKTIKPLVDSFTTPEILKRIEQISDEGFSKVKPEVKHKAIQDFQTVQNELKKFTNHDPVGRKPSPKRPRGHPVDYGLDKPRSKKNPK